MTNGNYVESNKYIEHESLSIVLIMEQLRKLVENFCNMSLKDYLDAVIFFFE
jgi:hypothetical protein